MKVSALQRKPKTALQKGRPIMFSRVKFISYVRQSEAYAAPLVKGRRPIPHGFLHSVLDFVPCRVVF
jgi:hypothetical protein